MEKGLNLNHNAAQLIQLLVGQNCKQVRHFAQFVLFVAVLDQIPKEGEQALADEHRDIVLIVVVGNANSLSLGHSRPVRTVHSGKEGRRNERIDDLVLKANGVELRGLGAHRTQNAQHDVFRHIMRSRAELCVLLENGQKALKKLSTPKSTAAHSPVDLLIVLGAEDGTDEQPCNHVHECVVEAFDGQRSRLLPEIPRGSVLGTAVVAEKLGRERVDSVLEHLVLGRHTHRQRADRGIFAEGNLLVNKGVAQQINQHVLLSRSHNQKWKQGYVIRDFVTSQLACHCARGIAAI